VQGSLSGYETMPDDQGIDEPQGKLKVLISTKEFLIYFYFIDPLYRARRQTEMN
jgi:hypothetical protein